MNGTGKTYMPPTKDHTGKEEPTMPTPNEQMDSEIYNILADLVGEFNDGGNIPGPAAFKNEIAKVKRLVLEGQQRTVGAVFDMSPKAKFIDWKPQDAFAFFERLKAYEAALTAELGELGK